MLMQRRISSYTPIESENILTVKETVERDFWPLDLSINRIHLDLLFMSENFFEFSLEFAEIFEFKVWLAAVSIAASRHCPQALYNSGQSKLAAEYVAASQTAPPFNIAESQNSPRNMWRLVKSRCKNI